MLSGLFASIVIVVEVMHHHTIHHLHSCVRVSEVTTATRTLSISFYFGRTSQIPRGVTAVILTVQWARPGLLLVAEVEFGDLELQQRVGACCRLNRLVIVSSADSRRRR